MVLGDNKTSTSDTPASPPATQPYVRILIRLLAELRKWALGYMVLSELLERLKQLGINIGIYTNYLLNVIAFLIALIDIVLIN